MLTKRQQIVDAIDARFKTVQIANAYETDAGLNVSQWQVTPQEEELPAGIDFRDADETITEDTVGEQVRELLIEVLGFCQGANAADVLRSLAGDIFKAVAVDVTWGGLAEDTKAVSPSGKFYIDHKENRDGIVRVHFEITYVTERLNAYQ